MRALRIGGFGSALAVWIVSGFCLLLSSGTAAAQGTDEGLAAAIETAKGSLRPVTTEQVAAARTALDASLVDLDRLLARNGGENRDGWYQYLRLDDLRSQIASETPDLALLREIHGAMRRKAEGLELRQFLAVRDRLETYIDTAFFAGQADQNALYVGLLERVAQAYPAALAEPTPENLSVLGRLVDRLESAGQAPAVVSLVRARFSRPNLFARVSAGFIGRNTERPVDDVRPVSEEILGTHQTGTAHTVGTVRLRPVPNAERAELLVELTGTNHSSTTGRRPVGRRNEVVIVSESVSSVLATKRLLIQDGGIIDCPADASACTRTTICNVCAPQLISGIATKQVYKNKAQAERIAAGRLADRTETQLDERVAESLVTANGNLKNELHVPLVRLDAHPADVAFSTTSEDLEVRVLQANSEQLAAPTAPPALDHQADASIVAHQSAINNLAEAVFGGKTISDRQAAEWVELGTGDLPKEFRISREDRWSITFATYQPVTVEFGESELTVRIRGSRFTRGDDVVDQTIEIAATYRIERTETGVRFTRQGEVSLTFPGRDEPTVQQQAIRSFMLEKFEALFAPTAETTGVKFPGRFADKAPMHLSAFKMTGGWLSLAWVQETP